MWRLGDLRMWTRMDSNMSSNLDQRSEHRQVESSCRLLETKVPNLTYGATVDYLDATDSLKFQADVERLCYGSGPWTTSMLPCP